MRIWVLAGTNSCPIEENLEHKEILQEDGEDQQWKRQERQLTAICLLKSIFLFSPPQKTNFRRENGNTTSWEAL